MGKSKVSNLEPAATAVAEIAWFIESKGMPETAKKFVDDAFLFEKLSDDRIVHKPCTYIRWETLGYRCVPFKKKYGVAYLNHDKEIVICDFVPSKLLA